MHTPGAQHIVANYLNKIEEGEPHIGVVEDFLDTNLFKVRIEVPQVCNNPMNV